MTPQEFCSKWGVKRSQLALLLSVSQGSIDHWFSTQSPRQPQADILKRLDEYNAILEQWLLFQQFQREQFPILYEIFQQSNDS